MQKSLLKSKKVKTSDNELIKPKRDAPDCDISDLEGQLSQVSRRDLSMIQPDADLNYTSRKLLREAER